MTMAERAPCKGRRKIEIQPIVDKAKRQVTFSKRRVGLFKKANELCLLCGVEAAIVTFSEAGKVFSFGHPNTDAIIHRYLNRNSSNSDPKSSENNHNYSQHYKQIVNQIEEEKRKSEVVNKSSNCGFWFDNPIDDLGFVELEELKIALETLRNQVGSRIDEINGSMIMAPQALEFGSLVENQVPQAFGFASMGVGMVQDNVRFAP